MSAEGTHMHAKTKVCYSLHMPGLSKMLAVLCCFHQRITLIFLGSEARNVAK